MSFRLLFCLLLLPVFCKAQVQGQQLIDSLLRKLPEAKADTDKIKLLNLLSITYKTIDPNEGIRMANEQLELATALGKKKGIGQAYNALGVNYYHKSNYTKALEYFNKALVLFTEDSGAGTYGSIISHIAVIYQEIGNYQKALEYNLKSLELDLEIGDSINIGGDYGNIGIIYLLKKDYDKALEYDFKSLAIFQQLNDKDGLAHNFGNIGNVYKEQKNYIKALEYDTKALDLFRELGDNNGIAINLGNIGSIYAELARDLDSPGKQNRIVPQGTKKVFLENSIRYLSESINLSKKIGQLDNIIEFSKNQYEAYMMSGNLDSAFASYLQYTTYKDSVYSAENKLKIADLETERELAVKDKLIQIKKLELVQKRNERIILIISLVLVLIVAGFFIRQFIVQKRRNLLLSKEKKRHLERIEKQKNVMGDIAYTHSHEVSGQVATILGLVDVFNLDDYTDPDNKVVIDGIAETAVKLDVIVKDMIIKENMINTSKTGGAV